MILFASAVCYLENATNNFLGHLFSFVSLQKSLPCLQLSDPECVLVLAQVWLFFAETLVSLIPIDSY